MFTLSIQNLKSVNMNLKVILVYFFFILNLLLVSKFSIEIYFSLDAAGL